MSLLAPPTSEQGWRVLGASADSILSLVSHARWAPLLEARGRMCYRVDWERGVLFAKWYRPPTFGARLSDFGIHRKPWKAFELGVRLARQGLATPHPVALLVRGRGVWREALLITEWIGPTRDWQEALGRGAPDTSERLACLARLLGLLHRGGYYHGDLPGNVVLGKQEGGREGVFLLDLDDLRRPLSWKRRVKNLEELGRAFPNLASVSLRQRWAFVLAYVDAAGLNREQARQLWRDGRTAQLRRWGRAHLREGTHS